MAFMSVTQNIGEVTGFRITFYLKGILDYEGISKTTCIELKQCPEKGVRGSVSLSLKAVLSNLEASG